MREEDSFHTPGEVGEWQPRRGRVFTITAWLLLALVALGSLALIVIGLSM